jgi:VIT1/CCC1 family predicted Fe2+/Mn2+ transporter
VRAFHHVNETHRSHRGAWLRAAVLGADDGIVSTACLMLGVAAGSASMRTVLVTGFAGLVAGGLSMAAGEYVSVSSQRDGEQSDRRKEALELERFPEAELRELTEIYVGRGLDRDLARQVAVQLHDHDALNAHLRDELNLTAEDMARPVQAAVTSAVAFAIGAVFPLGAGAIAHGQVRLALIAGVALAALAVTGALGAQLGGGLSGRASVRVLVGGGLAMGVSVLIGHLVGAAVG